MSAVSVQERIEELVGRLQTVERRAVEVPHEPPQELRISDDLRERLDRIEARLSEVSRDAGSKLGEVGRSEEHTSELQSLMRTSYAVFCLKKKKRNNTNKQH